MTPDVFNAGQLADGDVVGVIVTDDVTDGVDEDVGDGDIQGNSTNDPGVSLEEADPSPNAPKPP